MNCWKTVNVTREFGMNRIYLVSLLTGLLSFIFFYLVFSIIHQPGELKDYGMFPLLVALLLLPMMHNLTHVFPLLLLKKRFQLSWSLKTKVFPTFSCLTKTKMSKGSSILFLLAPTICITIPGLVMSYLFAEYFVYLLLFATVNIGLSFTDFLYTLHLVKAPRRCVIENDKDGYDILVS